MADIRGVPGLRHLRANPSMEVLRYRNGKLVDRGVGISFWFRPFITAVAEIPMDDRELTFVVRGTTGDFQEAVVQGVVTWRVDDAAAMAERVDFYIDLSTGRWAWQPLEQVGGFLTRVGQEIALEWLAERTLGAVLAEGVSALRQSIGSGLRAEASLEDMGLSVVTVRVASVQPNAEVEKALQTPVREAIQQDADQALFHRRALAVEKERAIAENELQNRIELSKREESLIEQQGANDRRKASEQVAAQRIRIESEARLMELTANAEAESVRLVEGARADVEARLMDVYAALPAGVMMGLAMRELAGKLTTIEHLNLTPDMFTPLLGDLMDAATKRLEA